MLHAMPCERVLAADEHVAFVATGGESGDRHGLYDRKRVAFEQLPVLEGPGLGLVGVADEGGRARGSLGNGIPFAPGGKGRTTTAKQPGVGQLADDTFRTKLPCPPQRGKTTMLAIA